MSYRDGPKTPNTKSFGMFQNIPQAHYCQRAAKMCPPSVPLYLLTLGLIFITIFSHMAVSKPKLSSQTCSHTVASCLLLSQKGKRRLADVTCKRGWHQRTLQELDPSSHAFLLPTFTWHRLHHSWYTQESRKPKSATQTTNSFTSIVMSLFAYTKRKLQGHKVDLWFSLLPCSAPLLCLL